MNEESFLEENIDNSSVVRKNADNFVKDKLKREVKNQLKKETENLLIETLPTWGPPAGIGCLIVIIIALIIFIAFMVIKPDSSNGTELANASQTKICLDAGHGGGDSGATNGTFKEADMNLTIVTELKPKLESAGYKVILTRDDNNYLDSKNTSEEESIARSAFCSNEGADLMYRVHLDASNQPQKTFHILPGPKYTKIHDASIQIGEKLHTEMIKDLGSLVVGRGKPLTNGGTVEEGKDYPRVLKGTVKADELSLPIIWLEALAINNFGVNWINSTDNRGKLEDAIVKGFLAGIPPSGGGSSAIVKQAKYYVAHPDEYKDDALRDFTDCGGFVETVFKKTGTDPDFVKYGLQHQAAELIEYFKDHPEKYQVVSENIKSDGGTSILKPGDILLNYKFGSHAAIYIGESGKNKAQASLYDHGPEYGNWYEELHAAVRLK